MKINRTAPIPDDVRAAVMKRAHGNCEDCGADDVPLELHHLRYETEGDNYDPGGEPIFGRETPDDLDALCRNCHHARHLDPNGDFYADPKDMEDDWFGYYWALGKND